MYVWVGRSGAFFCFHFDKGRGFEFASSVEATIFDRFNMAAARHWHSSSFVITKPADLPPLLPSIVYITPTTHVPQILEFWPFTSSTSPFAPFYESPGALSVPRPLSLEPPYLPADEYPHSRWVSG